MTPEAEKLIGIPDALDKLAAEAAREKELRKQIADADQAIERTAGYSLHDLPSRYGFRGFLIETTEAGVCVHPLIGDSKGFPFYAAGGDGLQTRMHTSSGLVGENIIDINWTKGFLSSYQVIAQGVDEVPSYSLVRPIVLSYETIQRWERDGEPNLAVLTAKPTSSFIEIVKVCLDDSDLATRQLIQEGLERAAGIIE